MVSVNVSCYTKPWASVDICIEIYPFEYPLCDDLFTLYLHDDARDSVEHLKLY